MGFHLNFELLWKHVKVPLPGHQERGKQTIPSAHDAVEENPSSPHLIPILLFFSSFLIISWFSSLLVISALIRDITRSVCRPQMKDELMDAQLPQLFDGWFSK